MDISQQIFNKNLRDALDIKNKLLHDVSLHEKLNLVVQEITNCLKNGGKVLFCGNGGSAADAQHLAAELSGRYYKDRPPLFAEALHVNTSYLTAIANDYSFEKTYSRLTEAFGRKGDVLIGISTSGNSENIVQALNTAKNIGLKTVSFTGNKQNKLAEIADFDIIIPSGDTPRIQEGYMLIGHTICELVELNMFGE